MTSTATMSIPRSTAGPTFAMVLRECRQQARLSQLALASEAQISSRHLSFLETGRSRPSREMALHLGQVLDLSLAQRNRLLEAAGFAAVYGRRELTDPSMAPAQSVIDTYLASLEPNPAIVTDRCWNVLQRNRAAQRLGEAAASMPGVGHREDDNLLLSTVDPGSLRSVILNWRQVAGHLVLRLRRSAPQLRLAMPIEHSSRAAEALAAGELDAAMIATRTPEGTLSCDLFDDEVLFLVGEGHPLASRATLRPKDIAEATLLVPSSTAHDALFARAVFGSRIPRKLRVDRVPVTEAIVELARAGLGIGVLSEWLAGAYVGEGSGLRVLRLRKGPIKRTWRLAYHPELASLAPLLVDGIVGARPASGVTSRPRRIRAARG